MIVDRRYTLPEFLERLAGRKRQILDDGATHQGFVREISRFLPPRSVAETAGQDAYWVWLRRLIADECARIEGFLMGIKGSEPFSEFGLCQTTGWPQSAWSRKAHRPGTVGPTSAGRCKADLATERRRDLIT
jgi:hypothetical protein